MKFLDAHTHVQMPAYDADREAVILRAREADVAMVNVGTQAATSRAACLVEVAQAEPRSATPSGYAPDPQSFDRGGFSTVRLRSAMRDSSRVIAS